MKIVVKSFLTFRQIMRGQARFEVEVDGITLRELLDQLCEEFGDDLKNQVFDPKTHKVSNMLKVLVNGRHYTTLPGKLETLLQDDDEVALFPPVAGG
jgi:molybdopterin synthase sulfur carrier subunit